MSEAKTGAAKAAPSKVGKLVAIGLAVVMLVGGGGGAFWWFTRTAHAEPGVEEGKSDGESKTKGKRKSKHAEEESGTGIVSLEPFLVNLADAGGSRFLRATRKLVVEDDKVAEHLTKNEAAIVRARSAILELLTVQTGDHLVTSEGKTALRKEICERVTPLTGGVEVTDVLFADFVVQF